MTAPPAWFAVTEYTVRAGRLNPLVHAKTYGTTATVCGLQAHNFDKSWDLPFKPFDATACRPCSAWIITHQPRSVPTGHVRMTNRDGRPGQ